jgi:GR25 family glycosyltransferase involved in LPS biosynthesis
LRKFIFLTLFIIAFFLVRSFIREGIPYIKECFNWYELSKSCPSLKQTIHNKSSKQRIDLGLESGGVESEAFAFIERSYQEVFPWCNWAKKNEDLNNNNNDNNFVAGDIYYLTLKEEYSKAKTLDDLKIALSNNSNLVYSNIVAYNMNIPQETLKLFVGASKQAYDQKLVMKNLAKFAQECQAYGVNRCFNNLNEDAKKLKDQLESENIKAIIGQKNELEKIAKLLKSKKYFIQLLPLGQKQVKAGDYEFYTNKTNRDLEEIQQIIRSKLFSCENSSEQKINFNDVDIRVINLDRSVARYDRIKKQLDELGLEHKRFSAIDGYKIKLIDPDNNEIITGEDIKNGRIIRKEVKYKLICSDKKNLEGYYTYTEKGSIKRQLTAGELGVACSHRQLWHELAYSDGYKPMLILEDDVVFNSEQKEKLFGLMLSADWNSIFLDKYPKRSKVKKCNNKTINKILKKRIGFWAYLISKQGAIDNLQASKNLITAIDNQISEYLRDNQHKNYYSTSVNIVYSASTKDSEINNMGRK